MNKCTFKDLFYTKPKGCRHNIGETVYCTVLMKGSLKESRQVILDFAEGIGNPDDYQMLVFRAKVLGYSWGDDPKERTNPLYVLEVKEKTFCNYEFYDELEPKDIISMNWSWVDILGDLTERKLFWCAPPEPFVLS